MVSLAFHPDDKRSQIATVTTKGIELLNVLDPQQSQFFAQVLEHLDATEQEQVKTGLEVLIKGLVRTCQPDHFTLRPLTRQDEPAVAQVIRQISAE